MAFDLNDALNAITGSVGREVIDDLIAQAMEDNPETVARLLGGNLKKRNPHLLNTLAAGGTEIIAKAAEKNGLGRFADIIRGTGHGIGSGLQRIAHNMQANPSYTPTDTEINAAVAETTQHIRSAQATAQRVASFLDMTVSHPRTRAAVLGLLRACEDEITFDNPQAFAVHQPSGAYSEYRGMCGEASQVRENLVWAMENRPSWLVRTMVASRGIQNVNGPTALATPEQVFDAFRGQPRHNGEPEITAIRAVRTPSLKARALDWIDLRFNAQAAEGKARGVGAWLWENKALMAIASATVVFLLLSPVVLLAAACFCGLLFGAAGIAYGLHFVVLGQGIDYSTLFLGILGWAIGVLTLPVFTDIKRFLSRESEDMEPPGVITRVLAASLQRLGFSPDLLLGPSRATSDVTFTRKLAKRVNIIVVAVIILSIVADIVLLPTSLEWIVTRGVMIVGLFVWLFVDFVSYSERALDHGVGFTADMARGSVRKILTPVILLLAFVVIACGGGLSLLNFGASWAWGEISEAYQEATEDEGQEDSSAVKPEKDSDKDSKARQRAKKYLEEREK